MAVSDDYMRSLQRKGVEGLTGQSLENFIKNWNSGAFSREQMDTLAPIASGVGAGAGYDYAAADAAWADYQKGVEEGRYASGLSKGSVIARSQGDWSRGLNIKEIMNPDLVYGNPPDSVINNTGGGLSTGGYGQQPAPDPTAPRPGDYVPSAPVAPPAPAPGTGIVPPQQPAPQQPAPQQPAPPISQAPPADPFIPQNAPQIDSFLPGSRMDPFYTEQFNKLSGQNTDFQNQQAMANQMRQQAQQQPAQGMPADPFDWMSYQLPEVEVNDRGYANPFPGYTGNVGSQNSGQYFNPYTGMTQNTPVYGYGGLAGGSGGVVDQLK